MKRSRFFYFHEDANPGKLEALERLHAEYRRYLQTCINEMTSRHRIVVPRKELRSFFPEESVLSSNIICACQQHAVEIVKTWAAGLYTRRLKREIKELFKSGKITESQRVQLFTTGKYQLDSPTETVSQEAIDLYWSLLLTPEVSGKTPIVSDQIGMRLTIHTGDIFQDENKVLTQWWVRISTLTKSHTIKVPIKANPFIMSTNEIVKGCLVRKDRLGRWRVETLEKKLVEEPVYDPKAPRIGVDVGLNSIAASSNGRIFGTNFKPKFDKLYGQVIKLRANRQRQGLRENSPRLNNLEFRLSGMVKTITGRVANQLVKEFPGHTFVVEDLNLKGCRGQKRFAYKALHTSLSKKAPCLEVNPAYTSKMCPSCGHISNSNRSGIKFHCQSCGRTSHADAVGARNILGRSEDTSISCDSSVSEVKALLRERYLLRRDSSSNELTAELVASNLGFTTSGILSEKPDIAPNS